MLKRLTLPGVTEDRFLITIEKKAYHAGEISSPGGCAPEKTPLISLPIPRC